MKELVLDTCVIRRCLKTRKLHLLWNTWRMFFQRWELTKLELRGTENLQKELEKLEHQDFRIKDYNFLLLPDTYWVVTYDKLLKTKLKKVGLLAPPQILKKYSRL